MEWQNILGRESVAVQTWEGPRWAKVESFAKDQAMLLGLRCKTEVGKGWIRERGRVEVTGRHDMCQVFLSRFRQAIDRYNA